MKRLYLLLFIVAISFLISCGKVSDTIWDEHFISLFNPTDEIIKETSGGIQDLAIEIQSKDSTCYLGQMLGNDEIFYLTLAFDSLYNISPDDDDFKVSISAQDIIFFNNNFTPREISGQLIVDSFSFDYEQNKTTCIICFSPKDSSLEKGEEILMVINKILITKGDETITSYGPFETTFPVNISTPTKKANLKDATEQQIGHVSLSSFKLTVNLLETNTDTIDPLIDSIKLITDNDTIVPQGFFSRSHNSVSWIFKELIDLNAIEYIEVDGVQVKIQ